MTEALAAEPTPADVTDAPVDAGKPSEPIAQDGAPKVSDANPDPKDAGSIANDADDDGPKAPQDWPDDWRQKLAGDDKKVLERLGRLSSPADLLKAYREAEKKISEGLKPKARPDEKATEEEWAAYRKEVGIPETVEKFVEEIKLPDGRQIGDADKPLIEAFAERAHKIGVAPADMANLIDEYYAIEEERANLTAEKDAEHRAAVQNELRQEWGGDYKANINAMRPYFEAVNPELFENLMGGRLADGTKVGDHPDVIRFFVAKALAENPAATIVPAGADQMQSINDEIKALETRMRDDRANWFKDTAAQERYQKLLEAQEKLSGK